MKHFHILAQFLLPRPLDFFGKLPIFLGGWLIALGEWNLIPPQSPPGVREFLFVLSWFLIQEGLIQQAKYMWNDLRDYGRDQIIPANQTRFVATHQSTTILLWVVLFRAILSFALAYWLSPLLFLLCTSIIILQILYELWAKPRATTIPLASLAIVAAGSLTRFLGGVFAAGWWFNNHRLWLYAVIFLAVGAAYGTVLWTTEARYLQAHHIPWQRGQSDYFLQHGTNWLKASIWCTAVVCTLLVVDAYRDHTLWPPPLKATTTLILAAALIGLFRFYATVDYEAFVLLHRHKTLSIQEKAIPTTIADS